MHCRMFNSIPGVSLLDAPPIHTHSHCDNQNMSPNITKCPLVGQNPLYGLRTTVLISPTFFYLKEIIALQVLCDESINFIMTEVELNVTGLKPKRNFLFQA